MKNLIKFMKANDYRDFEINYDLVSRTYKFTNQYSNRQIIEELMNFKIPSCIKELTTYSLLELERIYEAL